MSSFVIISKELKTNSFISLATSFLQVFLLQRFDLRSSCVLSLLKTVGSKLYYLFCLNTFFQWSYHLHRNPLLPEPGKFDLLTLLTLKFFPLPLLSLTCLPVFCDHVFIYPLLSSLLFLSFPCGCLLSISISSASSLLLSKSLCTLPSYLS